MSNNLEAYYHASSPWVPEAESGVRWDDAAFNIEWPIEPVVISDKDRQWP